MATTISNTRQLLSVSSTVGDLTLVGQVKLAENNALIALNVQINHSAKGNVGSFTAGEMSLESVSAQSPLRASVNVNNVSDLAACSLAAETMLAELAVQYPVA